MATAAIRINSGKDLLSVAQEAVLELSKALSIGSDVFIETPIQYSSGGYIPIRLAVVRGGFEVSDYALGYQTAEGLGAEKFYSQTASSAAKKSGLNFEEKEMYVYVASQSQLAGAISAVANSSKEALDGALARLNEHRISAKEEAFFQKIEKIFSQARVVRNHRIVGDSGHTWTVGAYVERDHKQAIFDFVKPHPNSIYPIVAKFHDLSRLRHPPKCFAAVRNKDDLKEYAGLIIQAGTIIEADISDAMLLKAA